MEEYEVSLGDYIRVLWQEKWVVIATFVAAVGMALIVSFAMSRQYQVHTALLILPPLYQEAGGQLSGTIFSPETYKRLASANDLLGETIAKAFPQGTTLTAAGLQKSMKVEVDQAAAEDFPGRFPLYLLVTIPGSDREGLVRLAQAWAELFVAKNAELFMTHTAQSLEYVGQTFEDVERELRAKQEALMVYLQENPETVVQAEIDALRSKYNAYLGELADTEKQIALVRARLTALQEALAQEPERYALSRAPSNQALWEFLAAKPQAHELEDFLVLTVHDEVLNTNYTALRLEVARTQAELASYKGKLAYLQEQIQKIQAELSQKAAKLVEIQTRRAQMEQEITVLRDTYNRVAQSFQEAKLARAETAEPIRIVETPVLPTTPIGPSKKLAVAVAGVLGLFLGVLLAFVVHYFQMEKLKPPAGKMPDQSSQDHSKENNP